MIKIRVFKVEFSDTIQKADETQTRSLSDLLSASTYGIMLFKIFHFKILK